MLKVTSVLAAAGMTATALLSSCGEKDKDGNLLGSSGKAATSDLVRFSDVESDRHKKTLDAVESLTKKTEELIKKNEELTKKVENINKTVQRLEARPVGEVEQQREDAMTR